MIMLSVLEAKISPHSVSPATPEDIPQLCTLLAVLFTQEVEFQPDALKQSNALEEIITHPEIGRILVMREGGDIIAMVNLLFTISTACGGKVGLLEDMVVIPVRRSEGLGSKLLQAAIVLAHQENCLRLTLLTDRTNYAGFRFYQRHGFRGSEMMPLRLELANTING
jgi:GNAT superfamily N-acetyltransferase